jgi:hypothetical protein
MAWTWIWEEKMTVWPSSKSNHQWTVVWLRQSNSNHLLTSLLLNKLLQRRQRHQ